jgi:hypothetical protein
MVMPTKTYPFTTGEYDYGQVVYTVNENDLLVEAVFFLEDMESDFILVTKNENYESLRKTKDHQLMTLHKGVVYDDMEEAQEHLAVLMDVWNELENHNEQE